jgi:hypothetical protein
MKLSYLKSKIFWVGLITLLVLSYFISLILEKYSGFKTENPQMILFDFISVAALCFVSLIFIFKKLNMPDGDNFEPLQQWSKTNPKLSRFLLPGSIILSITVAIPITALVYWSIYRLLRLSNLSELDEYFGYPLIIIWVSAMILGVIYDKKKV